MSGNGRRLKAGEYRFDRAMTPFEVLDKVARGDVYVITVTFPEGLMIAEMAKIFEGHGIGPASAFIQAAKDASLIHELDPAAKDLEGYLFPETYALPRKTDAAKLVGLMVNRFEHVFTPELRQAAAAHNLSVRQAVTLASIVEKESARADERPVVAAVYENRLRIGMALQCDPTVIYALQRAGRYTGNLRRDDPLSALDLAIQHIYRYLVSPGADRNPGRGSLEVKSRTPANADFLLRQPQRRVPPRIRRTPDEHKPERAEAICVHSDRRRRACRAPSSATLSRGDLQI
jgi:UPF0755 protein